MAMKARGLIVLTLLVMLLVATVACGGGKETRVEVPCCEFEDFQHLGLDVQVGAGDSLTVTLCSNPPTGFEWSELAQISDQSVLRQTEHTYLAPEGENDKPPAPGAPGKEVWTFKALKNGTAEVSMQYGRPWEGGEKGDWTFNLTVVVR
jgi:inhibitor of cysteine peptidase